MSKILDEMLKIALEAKNHARTQILLGGTWLENKHLSAQEQMYRRVAVCGGIESTRGKLTVHLGEEPISNNEKFVCGIRRLEGPEPKIIDNYFYCHQYCVARSSKYSVGNCRELAAQALDYILTNNDAQHVQAEIYNIVSQDHVILVINRPLDSHPLRPDTWGAETVICDPWANDVYSATEYRHKLTAVGTRPNLFNPVEPANDLDNTKFIRAELERLKRQKANINWQKTLVKRFTEKFESLIRKLKKYKDKLISERMNQKDNKKFVIILAKIEAVEKLIRLLYQEMCDQEVSSLVGNYDQVNTLLGKKFIIFENKVAQVLNFSEAERNVLFGQGVSHRVMTFFNFKSEIQKNLMDPQIDINTVAGYCCDKLNDLKRELNLPSFV